MAGQKKKGKGGYLGDFKKMQDGGYAYTGKTWRADPALRRHILIKLWTWQAGMILAALLPGLVTTAGLLNTFYVIIPYVFWLISDFALVYTLGNITFGGNPLRDYIYERSVISYRFRTMLPLTGAVLTALALLVFLLRGGDGKGAALCLVCCGVQTALSLCANRSGIAGIWEE